MQLRVARAMLILVIFPAAAARSDSGASRIDNTTRRPRLVLIIRHAEKPDDAKAEKDPDLAPRGFERAAALAGVIPRDFARPDYLFATRKSAHSNRPVETIEPLAGKLHLSIDSSIKDDQVSTLAHQLLTDPKYADKIVLIAWHHGKIPALAHALGAADAPTTWDSRQFDRVWEIDYSGGAVTWKDLPQKALPGDSQK